MFETRVLSGMRPTGSLHLGHYHGVLKNWVRLQAEYPCLFFVADWHALTTDYEKPGELQKNCWDMVIDWLAAGVDPGQAILFIQSQVPEHAELHLLLSMIAPLGWLERVPTYKDQQEKLLDRDLSTYGFLGYPLLQSADILIYRAKYVPVGEDQVPHVEFTREVARRFNHLYGREPGYEEKAKAAVKKMGSKKARLLNELRGRFLYDREGSYVRGELSEEEKDMLRRLDWRALIRYGVIFFILEKLAAAVGTTNQHIYAHMRGESLEDFQKTRKNAVLYSVAGTHKAKAKAKAEKDSAAKRPKS